jgi:hypothetical protein
MTASKTLEINPRHPIVIELNKKVKADPDSESTKDLAFILYDTALLQSGFQHDDTDSFADRMFRTLASNLKLDSLDLVEELEVPAEEEEEEESSSASSTSSGSDEF